MPFIQIHLLEGRSEEKIKDVIKNVTDCVADTLDAPLESIRVVVTEISPTHWGTAGKTKAETK
ncbi:4-oxalocrotonate tautomerase [Bacillus smithii]|uniref:4-oxalocrotonate tautomerase n=1 Tax=Bacillus smithii TaxID=1479 RepID=UPI002E23E402|nr:4-oxalocrotonate tautomerase [Bacillus smithii]MED1456990.1 4-oxalocrotonate tautomerase [Bacillus smithii]